MFFLLFFLLSLLIFHKKAADLVRRTYRRRSDLSPFTRNGLRMYFCRIVHQRGKNLTEKIRRLPIKGNMDAQYSPELRAACCEQTPSAEFRSTVTKFESFAWICCICGIFSKISKNIYACLRLIEYL